MACLVWWCKYTFALFQKCRINACSFSWFPCLKPTFSFLFLHRQDVQGLNSAKPDIVCLHSLKNEQASKASIKVMKDIQWTTFENAKRLVQVGAAQPTDFWVFMGYAGTFCPLYFAFMHAYESILLVLLL